MTDFSCASCGCPSVALPDDLTADALVLCYRCRRPISTWLKFRGDTERLIASDKTAAFAVRPPPFRNGSGGSCEAAANPAD